MKLSWSRFVKQDLEGIADHIALDSPRSAANLVRAIRAYFRVIAKQPRAYRIRPEIGVNVRLAVLGQYVIMFRIRGNVVRIERIVHGNRELAPILLEASQ